MEKLESSHGYSNKYGTTYSNKYLKQTWKINHHHMGVVQNTFSRTALNRSANRVATAVPQ